MLRDRFDQIILALLVVVFGAAALLLTGATSNGSQHDTAALNRQLEREIAYQARVSYLERHYQPVVELRNQGALQEALLKLEELGRSLPGEAHNDLMSGDILLRMGEFERSLTKLAAAVRRNPDYVDQVSPLNQRELIESAVTQGLPLMRDRLRAQPDSLSLERVVNDAYYMQSRLAGGCE